MAPTLSEEEIDARTDALVTWFRDEAHQDARTQVMGHARSCLDASARDATKGSDGKVGRLLTDAYALVAEETENNVSFKDMLVRPDTLVETVKLAISRLHSTTPGHRR